MKIKYSLYLCLLVLCLSGCESKSPADGVDAQGHAIYLQDYKGKWILLNYWATWCKACVEEIPELNRLYQQHQDQLVIFAVNFDASEEDNKFLQKHPILYPQLIKDPKKLFSFTSVNVLPATIIISPQGEVVASLTGPQTAAGLAKELKL